MSARVLLVEDELAVADFVVRGLREAGFVVDHAADRPGGLNALRGSGQRSLGWHSWRGAGVGRGATNRFGHVCTPDGRGQPRPGKPIHRLVSSSIRRRKVRKIGRIVKLPRCCQSMISDDALLCGESCLGKNRSSRWITCLSPVLLALAGCMGAHGVRDDEDLVKSAVRDRVGVAKPGDGVTVPGTVDLANGLSETEAVQLALCNNAAFQELLVDLGLAHSDLIQAGLLPNPEFSYVFGTDAKPFKYLVEFPVDSLVLRPFRKRAAEADVERTRERLTQAGLDLVRDAPT